LSHCSCESSEEPAAMLKASATHPDTLCPLVFARLCNWLIGTQAASVDDPPTSGRRVPERIFAVYKMRRIWSGRCCPGTRFSVGITWVVVDRWPVKTTL